MRLHFAAPLPGIVFQSARGARERIAHGNINVFMMLVRPEGLFPSARRRAELHAAEELGEGVAEQERAVFVEVEN